MPYTVVQMQSSSKSHFVSMVKVALPGQTDVFDELRCHTNMIRLLFMALSFLIALWACRSALMGFLACLLAGAELTLPGTGSRRASSSGGLRTQVFACL